MNYRTFVRRSRIFYFFCAFLPLLFASCLNISENDSKSSIVLTLPSSDSGNSRAIQVQTQNDIKSYQLFLCNELNYDTGDILEIYQTKSNKKIGYFLNFFSDKSLQTLTGRPGEKIEIEDLEENSYSIYIFGIGDSGEILALGGNSSVYCEGGKQNSVEISLRFTNTAFMTFDLTEISDFHSKISEIEKSSEKSGIYIRFSGTFSENGNGGQCKEIEIICEGLLSLSKNSSKKVALDFTNTVGLKTLKGVSSDGSATYTGACFIDCKNLELVVLPESLEDVGDAVFANCTSLREIAVASGNTKFKSVNGILYSLDGKTLYAYPIGKTNKNFNIPKGVTTIRTSAFWGAENLEKVTIPESCTAVGFCAFRETKNIKEITIPDSVRRIQDYTFRSSALEKITLGKNIITMGRIFMDCQKLSEINFTDVENWYVVNEGYSVWSAIRGETINPTENNTTEAAESDLIPKNFCETGGKFYDSYFYHGELWPENASDNAGATMSDFVDYDFYALNAENIPENFLAEKDGTPVTFTEKQTYNVVCPDDGIWNLRGALLYQKKDGAFRFYCGNNNNSDIRYNGDSVSSINPDDTYINPQSLSRYIKVPTYGLDGYIEISYGTIKGSNVTQNSGVLAILNQDGTILGMAENLNLMENTRGYNLVVPVDSSTSYALIAFSRNGAGGGLARVMNVRAPGFASGDLDFPGENSSEDSGNSQNQNDTTRSYTLILNANGGNFADGSEKTTITAEDYADLIRAFHHQKNNMIPSFSGKAFNGWSENSTTEDAQGDSLVNFIYDSSDTHTINALWKDEFTEISENPVSWFVSGDQNNSTWCATLQDAINQVIEANNASTEEKSYVIWFDKSLIDSSTAAYSQENNNAYCSIEPGDKTLNLDITAAQGGELQRQMVKANGTGRVFYIGKNANVTISNGLVAANGNSERGGGFYVASGGKLKMMSVSFCLNCESATEGCEDIYVEAGGILHFAQWNGERVYLESDAQFWLGEFTEPSVVTLPNYDDAASWLRFVDENENTITDLQTIQNIVKKIIPANNAYRFDETGKIAKKE